jgi:hypothetical protein
MAPILEPFVTKHPPGKDVRVADLALVAAYRGVLPDALLELWTDVGLGRYGGGLIQLVDPRAFEDVLAGWLMRPAPSPDRVPVAISAFGRVFYYRKLPNGAEDVAFLEPHDRLSGVLEWSLEGSFNGVLTDDEAVAELLEPDLYAACTARLGALEDNEIFYPVPALALGGTWDAAAMGKGDARVHLELLLQLAQ